LLRVLLVDDFSPFRRSVRQILEQKQDFQVVGEVSDGLQAVQKAEQLQLDLILLDIGLPTINGIEAARRIREHTPRSTVLFLSAILSSDIAQEALRTGASGYVVKADAASELLTAVGAVVRGEVFVSSRTRFDFGRWWATSLRGQPRRQRDSTVGLQLSENAHLPCWQKEKRRRRFSSNTFGMRSPDAITHIFFVGTCRMPLRARKAVTSSQAFVRNTQPFMDRQGVYEPTSLPGNQHEQTTIASAFQCGGSR
jgi:DNA-binding NarL/FixJ family response regulator